MTGSAMDSPASHAPLTLITLGGAELVSPQGPVLGPGKPLALLIYLATSPGHTASREFLIDLLWADMETERARHALRQTLWQIRQSVGDEVLKGREEISLGMPLPSDRDEFLEAVSQGNTDRAVTLYRGPFLPAFAAPGGAEFEHWADHERDRLRDTFLRTAELTVRRKLAVSQFRDAQRLARRARDESPANELGWRLLIESLLAGRDQVSARVEADALELRLKTDGRIPEPATRSLIATARRPESEDPNAPDRADLAAELIGREREFAALVGAWEAARQGTPQHVHIEAVAGLGKTRLLLDFQARLTAGGVTVRYLRAQPADRTISFATAGDLARAVAELPGALGIAPASAAALVSLNPTLSSRFAAPADTSAGDEALRRRTLALGEALVATAEEAPFALLLDDLHWCDRLSLGLLQGVLSRLREGRVLLVTASRPAPDLTPITDNSVALHLAPLTLAQTGDLVASLGAIPESRDWTSDFITNLHRCCNGSPLSVLETLKLALDEGCLLIDAEGWRCPNPDGLRRILNRGTALQARIASLPLEESNLLALLAAAGYPLGTTELAEATSLPPGRLGGPLLDLERRGLTTRVGDLIRVAHDEIAAAAIRPEERRNLDAALGRALAVTATDHLTAARAARHLTAAGNWDEVAALFERFAHAARRHGDRRPFRILATELLGDTTPPSRLGAMVSSLPVALRLGLWSPRRAFAAATLTMTALALSAYAALAARSPATSLEMVLWHAVGSEASETMSIPVDPAAWRQDEDITRQGRWKRSLDARLARSAGRIRYASPATMVFVTAETNEYTDDLFLGDGSASRHLVHQPSDDNSPDVSPDGRQVVFSSLHWSLPDSGNYDLAIQSLDGGTPTRLTATLESEFEPQWSPDGTRIAFIRRYPALRPAELCWITIDGSRERCRTLHDQEPLSVLGWRGPTRVLVVASSDSGSAIVQVGVDDALETFITRLPEQVSGVSAGPDGELVACRCGPLADERRQWVVFPTANPAQARALSSELDAATTDVLWWSRRSHWGRLDRLLLATRDSMVPLHTRFSPSLSGLDSSGRVLSIPPAVLRWSSSDTTIAEVDSMSGEIRPQRAGELVVHASAGGWRSASMKLTVTTPKAPVEVEREGWSRLDTTRWKAFGTPRPQIVQAGDGTPGLANNGDGSFQSGVYSGFTLNPGDGVSVEVMLSLPVNRSHWQSQVVWLGPSAALKVEGWDHRSTLIPRSEAEFRQGCEVGYPSAEGLYALRFLSANANAQVRQLAVDADVLRRGWHKLRIQVFPDGTCGIALDGTPLWRSTSILPIDRAFRLLLMGNSAGTAMLVGPLTIWQGVRTDVDWSKVPR